MTPTLATLRAVLERVPSGYTRKLRVEPFVTLCGDSREEWTAVSEIGGFPVARMERGTSEALATLLALAPDLAAALAQAVEALEAQPPPADAGLLAGAPDPTSGPHLGAVRGWIKWHFRNGSHVTWSSRTPLVGDVCADDLERLAERIREAVDADRGKRESAITRCASCG